MSARNNFVFQGLHIVAWVIFIGLCIEAGALIYNFIFRLFNLEFVQNLYDRSQWVFVSIYSFILVISILKAYLFFVVIRLLSRLNLSQPFNSYVAGQIKKISYYTLSIGLISYLGQQSAKI